MSVPEPRDGRREARPARRLPQVPARYSSAVYGLWTAGWITAFAANQWEIGLPMLFGTGALALFVPKPKHLGGRRGRRADEDGRGAAAAAAPPGADRPAPPRTSEPPSTPERRLAAAVVRAETSGDRLDLNSLEVVWELDRLLTRMLAQLRDRGGDPGVQHDVEAIAAEHLPAVLDAYLDQPAWAAHERTAAGTTPAEELRSQLHLLVEGCGQLSEALRADDVRRQQELSRFLDAKFRRSDLDL